MPATQALATDGDLKTLVEQYAQDKKAYNEQLGNAFIKMIDLGSESDELVNIENMLENHPFKNIYA